MTLLNLRLLDRAKLHRGELVGLEAHLARAIRNAADREHGRDLPLEMTFEQMVTYLPHDCPDVYLVRVSNINMSGQPIVNSGLFDTLCNAVSGMLMNKGTFLNSIQHPGEVAEWYTEDDLLVLSKRDHEDYLYVRCTPAKVKTFVFLEP